MPLAKDGMKICSSPNCVHGGKPQPISNFQKNKARKDGLSNECNDCRKKRYQDDKENILKKRKKYYNDNKEEKKKKAAEWKKKQAKYDTFYNQISKYEECQRDEKNPELLQIKCRYCGRFFNPTNQQIKSRLEAICGVGSVKGECNLYCSSACKIACPSYRQQTRFKGAKQATSREVQAELRQIVLERDNWTCQKCGKSKDEFPELELHCHHIDPVKSNPIESADVDNCVTFCKECHKWIHKNIPGCSLADLRKCINT